MSESIRILVVEDEGVVAKDLQTRLRKLGYEVPVTVQTGEDAIEAAKDYQPQLILMDVRLKGVMDGVEASAEIMRLYRIPVIFLTAYADEGTLNRAKLTDPYGFILKPFNERELHTAIQVALHKHNSETALRRSERWLNGTLRSIGDAIIAVDTHGQVLFLNDVATKLTKWSAEDAAGHLLSDVYHLSDGDTKPILDGQLPLSHASIATSIEEMSGDPVRERVLLARDGSSLPVEQNFSPILDDEGSVTGGVLVFRDISRRKAVEAAHRANEEQLQQANGNLAQYAFSASHDLREPLRNVVLYSQLLKKRYEDVLDQDGAEYLGYITEGARRMETLVTGLLTYAESGNPSDVPMEEVNVGSIVNEVLMGLRVAIEENNAQITSSDLPIIRSRSLHVRQILQNLIENAIKYRSERDPQIEVSAKAAGSHWIFSVKDNGIGINEEHLESVFGLFKRLHTRAEYPGAGLGLALCRNVIRIYNGRIWVESKAGVGSTFYFSLPG